MIARNVQFLIRSHICIQKSLISQHLHILQIKQTNKKRNGVEKKDLHKLVTIRHYLNV